MTPLDKQSRRDIQATRVAGGLLTVLLLAGALILWISHGQQLIMGLGLAVIVVAILCAFIVKGSRIGPGPVASDKPASTSPWLSPFSEEGAQRLGCLGRAAVAVLIVAAVVLLVLGFCGLIIPKEI
jgi:hypothetical protein